MINFNPICYLFFFALCLTACSPRYYTPDTHNIPLISEKGETNLSLSGSTERIEFQASHGITNHIAVKANGGFYGPVRFNNLDYDYEDEIDGSGRFIEFGAGYFNRINEGWIFETYGIFGIGSVKNKQMVNQDFGVDITENISAKIRRIGIQPNIGFKNEDFLFAFSSRFVNLSYQDIKGDLVFEQVDQQDYLLNNNSLFLIEPAVSFGVIFNKVDIRLQYGVSWNLTNYNFRQYNSAAAFVVNYSF